MTMVYASLGSNIDRRKHIQAALDALRIEFGRVENSSVYETEAVGFGGAAFFNLVSRFETNASPQAVNRFFKALETQQGRVHGGEKFSSRTLDVDLILYGDLCLCEPGLSLPRDEIEKYAFVLEPLAELAPDECYPGRLETFGRMWQEKLLAEQMTPATRLGWQP